MLRGMLLVAVLAAAVLSPTLNPPVQAHHGKCGLVDKRGDAKGYRGGLWLEKPPRVACLDHEG